jgi:hypothetical protein
MDPSSITASVFAIATVGFQLTSQLTYIAKQVKGAPKTIATTANEMTDLSKPMEGLGEIFKEQQNLYVNALVKTTHDIVSRFKVAQDAMEVVLKLCHSIKYPGVKHLKIVFKGREISDVRSSFMYRLLQGWTDLEKLQVDEIAKTSQEISQEAGLRSSFKNWAKVKILSLIMKIIQQ